MKNILKRALATFLVVAIVLTSAPLSGLVGLELPDWLDFTIKSSAATSGTCGDNLTWIFDYSTGTLTISGTGEMTDYGSSSSVPWESYRNSITSVTISDSVTSIGDYAFYGCTSLTSITFPDRVTTIGDYAFCNCTGLTSITFPDRVTSIGDYAVGGCDSLTSITFPDGVTSIGRYAVAGCDILTCITIPDSVTSIGNRAFDSCTSLTSITIPNSVTYIGVLAFLRCESLVNITVDEDNQYYSNDEYGVLFNKDKTTLIQYPIGNTRKSYTIPNSVTRVDDYSFYYCDSFTDVTIGDSVTWVGRDAFGFCTSLTSITIPDSVAGIGTETFRSCTSLTSLLISENVTYIGDYAFYQCTSLESIAIPENVTSIGDYAFYQCTSLESIAIPKSVINIGEYAFSQTAYYNDETNWENDVLYLGNYLLKAKSSITDDYTIKFGTTVIADSAFWKCYELTRVKIPESVTSISDRAFFGCTRIASITIPDSVTDISSYAFYKCTRLESIEIPESVTSIGVAAFEYCTNLADVYYTGTVEQWNQITIWSYNSCLKLAKIHYNSNLPSNPEYSGKKLIIDNKITFLDVGESIKLTVYSCDATFENGEYIYTNKQVVNNDDLVWSSWNEDKISISDDGTITALNDGLANVSVYKKDDVTTVA